MSFIEVKVEASVSYFRLKRLMINADYLMLQINVNPF